MKKVCILMVSVLLFISGCGTNKVYTSSSNNTKIEVSKTDTYKIKGLLSKLQSDFKVYTLDWEYSGSQKITGGTKVRLRSEGNLKYAIDKNKGKEHISGIIDKMLYDDELDTSIDYYIDNNTFYVKNSDDLVPFDYSSSNELNDLIDILCNGLYEYSDNCYKCKFNVSQVYNSTFKYLFGSDYEFSKTPIIVSIYAANDKITKINFNITNSDIGIIDVNTLDYTYNVDINSTDDLSIPEDFIVSGSENINSDYVFEYPSTYTYINGYAYPEGSLTSYYDDTIMGYGDYILDSTCMLDLSTIEDYSIFCRDTNNSIDSGKTISCYIPNSYTNNNDEIYLKVDLGLSDDTIKNLIKLHNSSVNKTYKVKKSKGKDIRGFKVTYTIPQSSYGSFNEPDLQWFVQLGEHDVLSVYDVTHDTMNIDLKLDGGCQITKYYIYSIDSKVKNESVCSVVGTSNSSEDFGNVYWR